MDGLQHHWLPYDLTSPDGKITAIEPGPTPISRKVTVRIEKIPPNFVGFDLPEERLLFNLKSTLAQIGLDGIKESLILDRKTLSAECHILLNAIGPIAQKMMPLIEVGSIIGKIFAADERRRVRNPDYLSRMFGRSDRWGRPLLSLGGYHGSDDLILDKVDGRCIAYLTLLQGTVTYDDSIDGFLPTIAKGLKEDIKIRDLLRLHQVWQPGAPRSVNENELLLVKTLPLHIRTVFGVVVDDLLSPGFHHTTASVLQPDTYASGDIYELYGSAKREITDIPLEFYTLEPYREFVFFSDRDQLQSCLDTPKVLFDAFKTAPGTASEKAAVFVVKGTQMLQLKPEDWTMRPSVFHELPGSSHASRQALMVERFIEQQPEYAFLKQIDDEVITSQGVLLTRYFPSPLMKRMYLSDQVQRSLKGIYFQYASQSHPGFFSQEDRAFLHDLDSFGIPVFWLDEASGQMLQYVQKKGRDSGMFVPPSQVENFRHVTLIGIYGSNLFSTDFEAILKKVLEGLLELQKTSHHPLLNKKTPLALVTGGGPGAMEMGNRVAKSVGILSCANIIDLQAKGDTAVVNEQRQNPFIDAKMTYRLDKLIERQAEFDLDFPILLVGGIGTDFEFSLEQVRRKTGAVRATPVLLLGTPAYWHEKITGPFRCNLEQGTIAGSEWVSNTFYCAETPEEALWVYTSYFSGTLPIGKGGPEFDRGFAIVRELMGK